jgi:5'-nucleotidase
VGASPAASALLQDEPSIDFLNILNDKLGGHGQNHWQVIGTLGNHEFDEGRAEMLRLIDGGNFATGPFLDKHYRGADFPYINCNVFDAATGKPILAPYEVRTIDKVKIGFVGAVTKTTPTIVTPAGVAGLEFRDEAESINASVAELKKQGVKTIVVLIHEGGFQTSYTGPTKPVPAVVTGAIGGIVNLLDDEVDVVLSAHTHAFTNTIMLNQHGVPILVTQAFSSSTAYADVLLTIDKSTGDVASETASIVTTFADAGPGLTPDADVAALTKAAEDMVAPLVNQVIGDAASAMNRTENSAGEQVLGNFIADAQRVEMGVDFAFMNPGGIRADLAAGTVTWGELFNIQPFGNSMVKMNLTGAQVDALLEQQIFVPLPPAAGNRFLSCSGLTYTWDAAAAAGNRVSDIRKNGVVLDPNTAYTVACNSFLSTGGDGFTVFNQGTNKVGGPVDLDALIAYIKSLAQPFPAPALNRITRLN